jgi:hypothetical protein
MTAAELDAALAEFASRIDVLAPDSGPPVSVTVTMSPSAAQALVAALRSYHDPRDNGACDQCATGRLDETFTCLSCGQPNGVFGQMVRERLGRHRQ